MKLSRAEFEAQYAARSGTTPEALRALGMRSFPCRCEYEECQGWQMVSIENARDQVALGQMSQEDFDKGCSQSSPGLREQ